MLLAVGCSTLIEQTTDKPVNTPPTQRTIGNVIDDEVIETRTLVNLRKTDPGFKSAHIVVVSYIGIVLLTGEVSTQQLKQLATPTVQKIRGVRRVHNELKVAGPISFLARSNDLWLKSKIKTRMLTTKGVNPLRVKVVVENDVVYLMGLVRQAEAQRAVEVSRKIYGVQKIVKVFEYID